MKPTTDIKGTTTVKLSKPDREVLAKAKTIMEQIAFHYRGTPRGGKALAIIEDLAEVLAQAAKEELEAKKAAPEAKA